MIMMNAMAHDSEDINPATAEIKRFTKSATDRMSTSLSEYTHSAGEMMDGVAIRTPAAIYKFFKARPVRSVAIVVGALVVTGSMASLLLESLRKK